MTINTILKKSRGLVVVEKKDLEKLTKENKELRLAVKAILAGELALRQKRTRTFREFLKSKFPDYAYGNNQRTD